MAFYIKLTKFEENNDIVKYYFSTNDTNPGVIEIEKKSGTTRVLEEFSHDSRGYIAERAARCLMKHWINKEYPDSTSWSS